jgi:hypothetical protein
MTFTWHFLLGASVLLTGVEKNSEVRPGRAVTARLAALVVWIT